ncbi:Cys-tRNA(Pro) deacylase [Larsenimonas suaedae]|uniref:Cys-tRNA(Pro)/Cys-tRNA(Cys) deacylase n=1 Tax=Larsenimonas suaedae TaxID=1851019 RepID=A0ABU1GZ72_9GAMM|nr:Cys-tRNA(Pro) deacylase [Larsenimonas suaedae]MCM2973171.1 Cys-tRNA(Pro) deacylase [Larsenimonas suaedae]MDR5896608.1 Cys-tRNA(Pro) deacylase [Larsenimonas suaedae]
MTPAIRYLEHARIAHQMHRFTTDSAHGGNYGAAAAEALGVPSERVFKTLMTDLGGKTLAMALVPVSHTLDLKALAKAAKVKKAVMAPTERAEKATGYVVGGISPLGQKQRHAAFIDQSAQTFDTIFVSGGQRGLDIELGPNDLIQCLNALCAPLARR